LVFPIYPNHPISSSPICSDCCHV